MPRFVVLDHDWPHPHRDLLLERDGVLKAWRLPPTFDLTSPVPAELNFDHRLHYLDSEGPVSGDRGSVRRWDVGELVWESCTEDEIRVRFDGTYLRGRFQSRPLPVPPSCAKPTPWWNSLPACPACRRGMPSS